MKKLMVFFGLAVLIGSASAPVRAAELLDLQNPVILNALIAPQNVINWKVGDTASYNITMSLPFPMTMVKSVTKDEGNALWVQQDVNMMIQQQKIEILLSKADGKILKMLVNGQEQAVPNDNIEIISQDYTEITVPAGKFQAIHVIAKSQQAGQIEAWVNPKDTVMEGTLKQKMNTQGMDMTIELTSFKRN